MELKDTVKYMLSDDYKERFIAEYQQLIIRARKLRNILDDAYNDKLSFDLSCPTEVLEAQYQAMVVYCGALLKRMKYEHIDPEEVKECI